MCEVWLCWLCLEARRVIRSNGPRDPSEAVASAAAAAAAVAAITHMTMKIMGRSVCVCVCVCVFSCFSHVHLCVTLWTIAHQSPLSIAFSRQEYWSELPCSPPGDLPNPGIKPTGRQVFTGMSPALAGRFFTTSVTWEAQANLTE